MSGWDIVLIVALINIFGEICKHFGAKNAGDRKKFK